VADADVLAVGPRVDLGVDAGVVVIPVQDRSNRLSPVPLPGKPGEVTFVLSSTRISTSDIRRFSALMI